MNNHWKARKPYWVIDMNTEEGHGLVGRWYFEDGRWIPEPPVAALRCATFHTRREALPYFKHVKSQCPHARLVRVMVLFTACSVGQRFEKP